MTGDSNENRATKAYLRVVGILKFIDFFLVRDYWKNWASICREFRPLIHVYKRVLYDKRSVCGRACMVFRTLSKRRRLAISTIYNIIMQCDGDSEREPWHVYVNMRPHKFTMIFDAFAAVVPNPPQRYSGNLLNPDMHARGGVRTTEQVQGCDPDTGSRICVGRPSVRPSTTWACSGRPRRPVESNRNGIARIKKKTRVVPPQPVFLTCRYYYTCVCVCTRTYPTKTVSPENGYFLNGRDLPPPGKFLRASNFFFLFSHRFTFNRFCYCRCTTTRLNLVCLNARVPFFFFFFIVIIRVSKRSFFNKLFVISDGGSRRERVFIAF